MSDIFTLFTSFRVQFSCFWAFLMNHRFFFSKQRSVYFKLAILTYVFLYLLIILTYKDSTRYCSTYHFDKYNEIFKHQYISIFIRPCRDVLFVLRFPSILFQTNKNSFMCFWMYLCVRVCEWYAVLWCFICSTDCKTYVFNDRIVYFLIYCFYIA